MEVLIEKKKKTKWYVTLPLLKLLRHVYELRSEVTSVLGGGGGGSNCFGDVTFFLLGNLTRFKMTEEDEM